MNTTTTILFFKPYGVLSQFTRETPSHQTLADFGPFPGDVYPAGRLDLDSEGLLILTSDRTFQHTLTDPAFGHRRTYLAQLDGIPDSAALEKLAHGIMLDGRRTRPAHARLLESPPALPERSIPIRFRKSIPTSWIELVLTEGRNRQVRRMTAAVGHPTLRLVRWAVGAVTLEGMHPGEWRTATDAEKRDLMKKMERKGDVPGRRALR